MGPGPEAMAMDPHQRLWLEVGYQALHAAGFESKADLLDTPTGVRRAVPDFVGPVRFFCLGKNLNQIVFSSRVTPHHSQKQVGWGPPFTVHFFVHSRNECCFSPSRSKLNFNGLFYE